MNEQLNQQPIMNNQEPNIKSDKRMNFEDIQKIFRLIYKFLTYIIIFIITIVVILSIINLLNLINYKWDDLNKKNANQKITYGSLGFFEWLNYVKTNYSNYNVFTEERGIYLQQMTLNTGIYFIYIIIILLLLNLVFYGILKLIMKENMIGAQGDNSDYFMDGDSKKLIFVSIMFSFVIGMVYVIEFQKNIFDPIKNIDDINKDIDTKITNNIIDDKEILEKCLNGSPLTVLKDYLEKVVSQENKEELIKKAIFTNNIITTIKKNVTDIKNHNKKKEIVNYLYNSKDSNEHLFGYLRINSFLLYRSTTDDIDILLKNIEVKDDEKLIILNEIRSIIEEIEESLKSINNYFDNINDTWYIVLMCLLCIILYIIILSVLLPIFSKDYANKGSVAILKELIVGFYNFIKENVVKIVSYILNLLNKISAMM
tara:strand:- start:1441 stop:2721 length:1281 start_codon:yes stop_codon:yes gene_type:complete